MSGIRIDNYLSAVLVALSISILNSIVRPILVFITFPITIITLGIFLLVVNAMIVMLADLLVSGFYVESWFSAIAFGILLSISRSLLFKSLEKDKE
jgi:putative membrane protein